MKKRKSNGSSETPGDIKKPKMDNSIQNSDENSATPDAEDVQQETISTKESNKFTGKFLRKAFNTPEALDILKKFVTISTSKKDTDLALGYLEAGGSVLEILKMLDKGDKRNLTTSTTVFSAMQIIIMKIVAQCPQYQSSAEEACRHFINTHLSSVHSLLSSQSNPKQRKVVLRLLTSIVALGGNLPRELLGHLSFHEQIVQFLAQHTMPTDPESVRTCFIHFILAFLIDGSTPVIRALLDKRGLLASIFPELIYDSHTTVNLVLNTVKSYVLENTAISKTMKLHVFSTSVTQSLVALYNWKGPKSWPGINKKAKTSINVHVDPEDKEVAVDAIHDFLTVLLTSSRHGIIFNDKSLGTSGRKHNQLANSILQSLDRPWEHEKPCDLVVKILAACPDLIKPQLSYTEAFLEPRESPKWLAVMAFVQKIIGSIDPEISLKSSLTELNQSQLISATLTLAMPLVVLKTGVTPCLKSSSIILRHEAVKTLGIMLNQMKKFFQVTENHFQESTDFVQYKSAISNYISKNIPSIDEVLEAWSRVLTAENENSVPELINHIPTRIVHFSAVLDLLQALRDVCPELLDVSNESKVPPMVLMQGLKEFEEFDSEELNEIKIKAIQIILALDPASFKTKDEFFGESLVFLISLLSDTTSGVDYEARKTIKMLLMSSKIFKDTTDQLDIWLNCFTLLGSLEDRLEVAEWFVKVVQRARKHVKKFSKMIIEPEGDCSEKPVDTNPMVDMINNLSEWHCDKETNIPQIQPSSSIPIALCAALDLLKENPLETASLYLSYVVVFTLHCQIVPETLINLCENVEVLQKKYVTSWKEEKSAVKKPFSPKSLISKFSKMLLSEGEIDFEGIFEGEKEVKIRFDNEEIVFEHSLTNFDIIMLLRMTLFYLTQFLRRNQLTRQEFHRFKKVIVVLLDIAKDLNQKKNSEDFRQCLGMILCNPVILQYFSPITKTKNDQEDIVTKGLIGIFEKIVEITGKKVSSELFMAFKNKLISQLRMTLPKSKTNWRSYNLDNSVEFLAILQLGKENIVKLLKDVSTLSKYMFLGPQKQSLSTWGLITPRLIELLASEEEEKNFYDEKRTEENINVIQNLINRFWQLKAIAEVDLDVWEVALHNYLHKHPHNIAKVEPKKINILFDRELKPSTVKLISFLINRNDKFIPGFVQFVSTHPDYFQRSDVIFPILSSNLSFKWDQEFLKNIFKHHKEDIVSYFSFSMEKKNSFDENEEIICYLIDSCMSLKTSQKIIDTILSSGDKLDGVDVIYIKLLRCLFYKNAGFQENKSQVLKNWVQVLIRLMVCALKKPSKTEDKLKCFCNYLSDALDDLKSTEVNFFFEEITKNPSWPQFSRFSLKNGLKPASEISQKPPELLQTFAKLCNVAYNDKCEDEHVKTIFEMTTSHSEFINLMLSSHETKRQLLELLWVLVNKNYRVMASSHVSLYLSAYTGTLNVADQLILRILQHYEAEGIKFSDYKPYLWGEAAASHYSVKGGTDTALWRQPGTSQVLDLLNVDTVKNTIRNFPIFRDLKTTGESLDKAEDDIYDPAFYLPLLNYLLTDNNVVACHKVTQSGALALIFAACGSARQDVRMAAFTALSRFYFHLEATSHKEKLLWMRFTDALRNGIISLDSSLKEVRLSCLVSTFLAETSLVTTQPLNPLFAPLQSFLMAKPALDLNVIPEFLTLFHSSEVNHKLHRHWILEVIRDGMKTEVDMHLAMKCVLFRMLFDFYHCILADPITKNLILQTVNATIKIPKATILLCRGYSLLPWLNEVTTKIHKHDLDSVNLIIDIVRNLLDVLLIIKARENNEFILLVILKTLRVHLSKNINLKSFNKYLTSLNDLLDVKSLRALLEREEVESLVELTSKVLGNRLEECEEILRYGGEFVEKEEKNVSQVNDSEEYKTKKLLTSILIKWHSRISQ